VPTLVIHGVDDTLIDPTGGERTAALVPVARLVLVEDMGHDRPPALWPHLVDAISEHIQKGLTRGATSRSGATGLPLLPD
jgi:pimeloyl-ACP methyl ester carboxylesterase